jgi:ATP-dependent DNA helicase RecG
MADVKHISDSEALFLCTKRESDLFDRKAAAIDGKKIEKIAVAFANADGGEFVVGIADDKDEAVAIKRWQGKPSAEDYNFVLQCVFNLNPAVSFRYEFFDTPNLPGVVLRVYIDRSQNVCKATDGKVRNYVANATRIPRSKTLPSGCT